jgi:hypothetical protein
MKNHRLSCFVGAFLSLLGICHAQSKPADFVQQITGDLTLSGGISLVGTESGSWKPLQQKLQAVDDGFTGSFTGPSGNDIPTTFSTKQSGKVWESKVTWTGETASPAVFLLLTYIIPGSELAQARLVSGNVSLDIEKILNKVPTRTNVTNITAFSLEIPGKPAVQFTLEGEAEVQVVLLGENIYLRIFLTRSGEEFPAGGSAGWTVGIE